MGNTCSGPNLGGNGFLQNVTAAVWKTRPPESILAPNKDESGTNEGNWDNKSKADTNQSDTAEFDVVSTPPQPVKIDTEVQNRQTKAEVKENGSKKNASAANAKPMDGTDQNKPRDMEKQNKSEDGVKQNKPEGESRRKKSDNGERHNKHEDGARQKKPDNGERHNKHEDGAKQKKPDDGARQNKPEGEARRNKPENGERHNKHEDGARQKKPDDGVRQTKHEDRARENKHGDGEIHKERASQNKHEDRARQNKSEDGTRQNKRGDGVSCDKPEDRARQNKAGDGTKHNKPEEEARQNKSGDREKQNKHENRVKQNKPQEEARQDKSGDREKHNKPEEEARQDKSGDREKQNKHENRVKQNKPEEEARQNKSGDREKQNKHENRVKQNKHEDGASQNKHGDRVKQNKPEDGVKQNKHEDGKKRNKIEDEAKHDKPGDGAKQHKPEDREHQNKPVEEENQNQPSHMKRMSSVGLQVESVLQRKTGIMKDIYTLGRKLGQGQFGTTFLCVEKVSNKEFACKTIAKRKLITEEDLEDVRREIQIMHHLAGHPNIIQIIDAYEDAVGVHVVMDLCSGGELFDRIIERGHYSERKAAELARIIVGVIQTCHSLGVMHRDLKPENFLFVDEKEESPLKTIDFGLSMFFKPGETFTDVVGSPYYVAPEVLRKFYGPECDIWSAGVIIYILLSGVPPFWDESEQGIFEQVLRGDIDFESEPWPNISESAKDLVRKMLVRDPKKRLTAHEVLSHPWVRIDGVAPDKPLDSAVLSRLKQFSEMNKLKKMAIRVIAETLSEEEIAGLREMFRTIDVDNSGQITLEELKNGLNKVGTNLKHSEIVDLMQAVDIDNNGTIDYHEFVAAMLHLNKVQEEDHMFAAFSYFDKDGSGYITRDELKQACEKFGLGDAHLEEIIREVDRDNDGRIDYSEFVSMMHDTNFGRAGAQQKL